MKKRGLIIGKFMPVHAGHLYLFDKALEQIDELNVIIFWNDQEPIPGRLRLEWLRKLRPQINFYECTDRHKIDFNSDQAWKLWTNSIRKLCPEQQDYVFSSENYGLKLAEYLGAKPIFIDPKRTTVPVCATYIRNNPFTYWEYIPEIVKPYFVKKVCICGGESTGKTTLAKELAEYFETIYVEEYAREFLIEKNGICNFEDLPIIALEQFKREEDAKKSAKKVIFCDTNALTTKIWSKYYFNCCDERIESLINKNDISLYLLNNPDIPWVPDGLRDSPNQREFFYHQFKNHLRSNNLLYYDVNGSGKHRRNRAIRICSEFIKKY